MCKCTLYIYIYIVLVVLDFNYVLKETIFILFISVFFDADSEIRNERIRIPCPI